MAAAFERRVNSGLFCKKGYPFKTSNSARPPMASAMPSASFFIFSRPSARQVSSMARKVPAILTSSGMTFVAPRPSILPKVKTDGSFGFLFLEMICCIATMMWEAMTIGSMQASGMAPWPPLPITLIYNSSVLAMYIPSRKPIFPTGTLVATCWPKMLVGVGFCKAPSLIIMLAPPGAFSSAGWKSNLMVPSNSPRTCCKMWAVPKRDAVWTS